MSHGDTIPLHPSSQSDIDEIESLINAAPSATVLPARPPSPPRASIPVSSSPAPPPSSPPSPPPPELRRCRRRRSGSTSPPPPPPSPRGEAPGRDRRRWLRIGAEHAHGARVGHGEAGSVPDRLTLSWSASVKKSEVFAVAFAVLAAGAIILTVNVLLLGGHIIFFQSLSLLGYCLFPLDIGALICMLKNNVIIKIVVVTITLAWSSWAAYPFMSAAVNPRRKALALYPVFLMYISVGFLIIAID
uniref:Protein YIP n=1 Tax=Ananas comosus var. bracteatus TaxID=296719 RepID=A0A6V7NHB1_ANACO|nr:unnamed protein product [Ananas comosus var. bracteatus]